jgi:tyrosine-protein kinase Etk/Wzc
MTPPMPAEPNNPPVADAQPEDVSPVRAGELDLFALVLILVRHLRFILGCGLVAFLVMVVMMLNAKPRYAATAVMIVPQGNITASSIQSQIAANTLDLLGGGFELYADILKSRTVADRLIKNHDLMTVYGTKTMGDAEYVLAEMTKVQTSREGMLRVTTQDGDAQRAADLANDYLRQLDMLNSSLVLTSVSQERAYLEREMIKEKDALADAEVALQQVQEKTSSGLAPDAIATAGLTALVTTRAQLRADQIQLAALLTGETDANPEVIRLRSEIAGLTRQVETLQNGADSTINGLSTSKVPAAALEYTRRKREVTFHESLFGLLEKQFDAAKSQEAKTPSIVEVLDPAVPAQHKAWPPRTYYCLMALIVGTVLGVVLVLLKALVMGYARAPQNQPKLQQMKSSFSWLRLRKT